VQVAVLASGLLRLAILLLALTLLLAPFGEGPHELLGRTGRLGTGITVGALELRPASVLQAVLVFTLALAALRVLQNWLACHFLPATSLDAGMRSSLVTLLGFVGLVVAVALGLSAVGLALDKVAWIASALTVGVGFGMQAVVSNFVSGLILLAERPVKVGDWVALGGVEGDIRRINVRATEIRMGDRSTVIVPNSEFITKVVRNVTHDNPLGLVQLRLPLPLDVDVERVRTVLQQAFEANEEVLREPPPNVLLDGVDGDKLVFNATGFVSSPRKTAATRSPVLFKVMAELRRLRETGG
jgi:small-conductance mechanosensitive channel